MSTKYLYIIAGCNGAGKTTASHGIKGELFDIEDKNAVMEPKQPYLSERQKRMIEACNKALLDMITECALHDDLVVLTDRDDNPIWVRAREVLEKNPGLKRTDVEYTPVEVDIKKIISERQ